jgi:acetamidase/formamidase
MIWSMPRNLLLVLLAASLSLSAQTSRSHRLASTPETVVFGYYDAATPPVLRIRSGDSVEITTSMIASPEMLEEGGLPSEQIKQSLRDIHSQVTDRGPGPHILTGPVAVEGAEPGDVLQVDIEQIRLALPYALNIFLPGLGVLPEDYPYKRLKIIPLDEDRMIARFADGIEIPLQLFFGSMGVAPPKELGRISSAPPWIHTGNLDNKDLVAGTTLFMPVHEPGALFFVGDAHAAQGAGEVDVTALETALSGTFRFTVRKDLSLRWPRAETPTHFMTMGFDEDLDDAIKVALREMIDFLVSNKGLSRDDAYMLASNAVDLHITQLVDGRKGIHATVPKTIFTRNQR